MLKVTTPNLRCHFWTASLLYTTPFPCQPSGTLQRELIGQWLLGIFLAIIPAPPSSQAES